MTAALTVAGEELYASKTQYRYAQLGFTPVATPTDVILIQGSALKTRRIKRVKLGGVATAAGNQPAQLIKRTSAPSLGSAVLTAVTAAQQDSGDPAPAADTNAVSTVGTANITTPGTAAGTFGVGRVQLAAAGSGVAANDLVWDFATRMDKAPVLRGVAQYLCVNLNGIALPTGAAFDFEIEIEEDNS